MTNRPSNTYDIIVIGSYFFDEIYVGLPQFPVLGREIFCDDLIVTPGATYITAAGLTKLGVNTGWICCFGNDHYSQYIYARGQKEGLDLSLVRQLDRPYRQVTTSLPFDGERAFVTVADPKPNDMVAYMMAVLAENTFKHLHLAWLPGPDHIPLIELARQKGATVSADCQDVAMLHKPDEARKVIANLDIFMPNTRELCLLTGCDSPETACRTAASWVKMLIVKDGANGVWLTQHNITEHIPGIHVDKVIDTTGAGDSFNVGFLRGFVVEGKSPRLSAMYGNVCGGYSVQGVGGTANQLDYTALCEAIPQHYTHYR
jgi:sugar/nucleoside kinase (ribokinase family)